MLLWLRKPEAPNDYDIKTTGSGANQGKRTLNDLRAWR